MKIKDDILYKKPYDAVIYWDITKSCNFHCPQCTADAKRIENLYVPEKIDISILKKFLKKINRTVKFTITGGEPLFVENILDILHTITEKHIIGLISNLVSDRVSEIANTIDPNRVEFIKGSAHIQELERLDLLETFFSNCHLLKRKGFPLYVCEVGYPFIMNKVSYYRKLFNDNGIELSFQAFRGNWENKKYPEAYTKEEIDLLDFEKIVQHRADIYHHKNELCNAGYNAATIDHNGNIYPCLTIFDDSMGTIKKGIKFRKNLIKCPVEFCNCPFTIIESYLYEKAIKEVSSRKNFLFK
jgi:MoaA/NifB/PqqE/SkfB family radical SAM enzyme